MKKLFISTFVLLFSVLFFSACGGGGSGGESSSSSGGNIDNVIVDPQAYYIDAVDGNDANDGKTPQTAWKTLTKLNSITVNAGNKLLFRTGQTWQGQLEIKNNGTAENPIVIGKYGEGNNPVISAVGLIQIHEDNNNGQVDDNEWVRYDKEGGISIKFKEPVSDPQNTWLAIILNSHPYRLKINGQELVGAFDSTELGNTFKWSYNRDKPGEVFYYYGNDKPSEIETNIYTSPLYIHDNQYIQIENIVLKGGYVASLFIENANNISINNIEAGDMAKQGIYVKAVNTVSKNISIKNCKIDSKYTLDYSTAQANVSNNGRTTTTRGAPEGIIFLGGIQNSVISDNFLKNWTHANINFSADNEEELAYNSVYNNELTAPDIAYGGRIGVDGKNTHHNEFYSNTIHDIKAPIQFNGHDNSFHDNNVYNIFESVLKPGETGYGIILQAYTSPVYNNKIINNTFKNIAKDAIKIIAPDVTNITTTPNTYE